MLVTYADIFAGPSTAAMFSENVRLRRVSSGALSRSEVGGV